MVEINSALDTMNYGFDILALFAITMIVITYNNTLPAMSYLGRTYAWIASWNASSLHPFKT